jgi:hypothetical protein
VRLYGESDAHACSRAPDAVVVEVLGDAAQRAPLSTDRDRAARWTLFAANALAGLLSSPIADDGKIDAAAESRAAYVATWAEDAAEYADAMLEEHNKRFDVFGKDGKKP